jgi:phosphoribosylformylglycinamidine cyclo-ligase
MYHGGDYDLAGFAVGAVERKKILPREDVKSGDVILGLASSGPHSNGYSLIRKIVEISGLALSATAPFDSSQSLSDALLVPTRIYVKSILKALKKGHAIKALAHITGGGFTENIPRVLPTGMVAEIDLSQHKLPPVFRWLQQQGGVSEAEMLRTFNCGIGMVVVISVKDVKAAMATLKRAGEQVSVLGKVTARKSREPQVRYLGQLD